MVKAQGVGCIVVFYRDAVAALCGLGRLDPVVLAQGEGAAGSGESLLPLGCIGACKQLCPPPKAGRTPPPLAPWSLSMLSLTCIFVPGLGFLSAAEVLV